MPRGRTLTPVQQEQLIKSYEQSNLSKAKYCRQFGVSRSALYRALTRLKSGEIHSAGFCPVVLTPRELQSRAANSAVVTIRGGRGIVVEIAAANNAAFVADILRVLL
jgi:transposase-like protein